MWHLYILYSEKLDRYYIDYSKDIELRLERHNAGWGKYTCRGIPWRFVYSEAYATKSEAIKRERYLKSQKSRAILEKLIERK